VSNRVYEVITAWMPGKRVWQATRRDHGNLAAKPVDQPVPDLESFARWFPDLNAVRGEQRGFIWSKGLLFAEDQNRLPTCRGLASLLLKARQPSVRRKTLPGGRQL
jgi:hypothetical protein